VFDFTISESKDSASWTAFGREWRVQLELSNVVEDNTDYYLGTLEGDASAAVSFALLPGTSFSGMIATGDTTWWIKALPVLENNLSEEDDDLGVFMIRDTSVELDEAVLPTFETPLEPDPEDEDEEADEDSQDRKRAISSYKVAVFYDQQWASSRNPWGSQANTLALFNDVNAIYRAAGLGRFKVGWQKQISRSRSGLSSMLSQFSRSSNSAFNDRSYTNYIWLVGANVGGLGYVGSSCRSNNQRQKSCVAGLVGSSRLWTVKTIAHELGHNRGAPHEFGNQCSGAGSRAGCQCSVMSYCFPSARNNPKGAVNYFSSASISRMRAAGCH
jgi:hypothetical protein